MKKYLLAALGLMLTVPAYSFEDSIISTNGKLNDIKIQYNDIIDVYPLITIMNDKNTLIVHPLKQGVTKFSVVKNEQDKYVFNVEINDEGTYIEPVEGFDILSVDKPPDTYGYLFDLDMPPGVNKMNKANITDKTNDDYINQLDMPPFLKGEY